MKTTRFLLMLYLIFMAGSLLAQANKLPANIHYLIGKNKFSYEFFKFRESLNCTYGSEKQSIKLGDFHTYQGSNFYSTGLSLAISYQNDLISSIEIKIFGSYSVCEDLAQRWNLTENWSTSKKQIRNLPYGKSRDAGDIYLNWNDSENNNTQFEVFYDKGEKDKFLKKIKISNNNLSTCNYPKLFEGSIRPESESIWTSRDYNFDTYEKIYNFFAIKYEFVDLKELGQRYGFSNRGNQFFNLDMGYQYVFGKHLCDLHSRLYRLRLYMKPGRNFLGISNKSTKEDIHKLFGRPYKYNSSYTTIGFIFPGKDNAIKAECYFDSELKCQYIEFISTKNKPFDFQSDESMAKYVLKTQLISSKETNPYRMQYMFCDGCLFEGSLQDGKPYIGLVKSVVNEYSNSETYRDNFDPKQRNAKQKIGATAEEIIAGTSKKYDASKISGYLIDVAKYAKSALLNINSLVEYRMAHKDNSSYMLGTQNYIYINGAKSDLEKAISNINLAIAEANAKNCTYAVSTLRTWRSYFTSILDYIKSDGLDMDTRPATHNQSNFTAHMQKFNVTQDLPDLIKRLKDCGFE